MSGKNPTGRTKRPIMMRSHRSLLRISSVKPGPTVRRKNVQTRRTQRNSRMAPTTYRRAYRIVPTGRRKKEPVMHYNKMRTPKNGKRKEAGNP